jgi:hemoglobin
MNTLIKKSEDSGSKRDIETVQDIEILVDCFYQQVREDELLGPVFQKIIPTEEEWGQHLETMNKLWKTVLYSKSAYRGNPFPRHIDLEIGSKHFDRWLVLFGQTVDNNFSGNQADGIKKRSRIMRELVEARLFDYKK